MAFNKYPTFVGKPFSALGEITAATTTKDGTGTITGLVTLYTATDAEGALIEKLHYETAAVGTASSILTVFIKEGSNYRLVAQRSLASSTSDITNLGAYGDITDGWYLNQNQSLVVGVTAISAGTKIHLSAFGGSFAE